MTQQAGQILRKNEVKIAGSCRIGGEACVSAVPRPQAAGASNQKPQPSVPQAQAQIVENTAKGVIIEVVCPCGCKSYIECEYAQ
jgi:hypothetical protein